MDTIAFPSGHGELFIKNTLDAKLNNPTSTKQNVNSTTGLVVLASDQNTRRYLHNVDSLGGSQPPTNTPTSTPTPTKTPTATPTTANPNATATNTPTSDADQHVTRQLRQTNRQTATRHAAGWRFTHQGHHLRERRAGPCHHRRRQHLRQRHTRKRHAAQGGYSATLANVTSSYLQENFTAADDVYVSFVLRVNALPGSSARIAIFSNSGTTVGNIQLMPDSKLGCATTPRRSGFLL